jgi:hypothetical protein
MKKNDTSGNYSRNMGRGLLKENSGAGEFKYDIF